uniref:Major sperm protein n=1 Tax=Meloidogyne floridensis TaxID=298350 RepID=A0A915NTD5_9BILA
MAVSLDPESIQVAAAGGEITLQLKNSSAEEGPPKADGRLEVHFIPAPADATDAKALFPPGSSSEFKLNVPLIAE